MFDQAMLSEHNQHIMKLGTDIVTAILERKPGLKLGDKMAAPIMTVGPDGRAVMPNDDTNEHAILVVAIAAKIELPLQEDSIDAICESAEGEYLHPYKIEIATDPFNFSEYAIFRFGIS